MMRPSDLCRGLGGQGATRAPHSDPTRFGVSARVDGDVVPRAPQLELRFRVESGLDYVACGRQVQMTEERWMRQRHWRLQVRDEGNRGTSTATSLQLTVLGRGCRLLAPVLALCAAGESAGHPVAQAEATVPANRKEGEPESSCDTSAGRGPWRDPPSVQRLRFSARLGVRRGGRVGWPTAAAACFSSVKVAKGGRSHRAADCPAAPKADDAGVESLGGLRPGVAFSWGEAPRRAGHKRLRDGALLEPDAR